MKHSSSNNARFLRLALAILMGGPALGAGPVDEPVGEPTLIRFSLKNVPLGQALDTLIAKHRIPIVYQGVHVEGQTVSAESGPCSIEEGLDKLLTDTPLTWRKVGTQYVVIRTVAEAESILGPIGPEENRQPLVIPLQNMVVTPSYFAVMKGEPGTRQMLSREDIEDRPKLGDDLFHAVEYLPGIGSADISAPVMIRGGSAREALVLLDGAEIEQPYHLTALLSGIFSIFDTETVGGLELMTGGFPIEYGNKMSGVFNISTATPQDQRTTLAISLLNLRVQTQGTFSTGRGQYLLSGRQGYLDPVLGISRERDPAEDFDISYGDFFAKIAYQVTETHALSAHVLTAKDHLDFFESYPQFGESFELIQARNKSTYSWLKLNSLWNGSLYSETVVTAGRFSGTTFADDNLGNRQFEVDSDHRIESFQLRQDWSYEFGGNHYLKWGATYKNSKGDLDYRNEREDYGTLLGGNLGATLQAEKVSTEELGVYMGDRFRLSPSMTAELGLRYDRQTHTRDSQWSPRLHFIKSFSDRHYLKLGWGRFFQAQSLSELQIEDEVSHYFPAMLAEHWILSYDRQLQNGIRLRSELYYKDLSRLHLRFINFLNPQNEFPEAQADRIPLNAPTGEAKGLELLAMRHVGDRLSWMANYAISKVTDNLDGMEIPRDWDQRHAVNLSFNFRTKLNWRFHTAWHYHTGWRTTEVGYIAQEGPDGMSPIPTVGPLNRARLKNYHRMDLRIGRRMALRKGEISYFLEIINVYDRGNIQSHDSYELFLGSDGNPELRFDSEEWVPRLPIIGLSWTF